MEADTYYTLDEAVAMMEDKAEGTDMSVMENNMTDVLDFFISVGNYTEADREKFAGTCGQQAAEGSTGGSWHTGRISKIFV